MRYHEEKNLPKWAQQKLSMLRTQAEISEVKLLRYEDKTENLKNDIKRNKREYNFMTIIYLISISILAFINII